MRDGWSRAVARAATLGALAGMTAACGGGGGDLKSYQGVWCHDTNTSTCLTLRALEGGTPQTDTEGALNTMELTFEGKTSTASSCSSKHCLFYYGPSIVKYPAPSDVPKTLVDFSGDAVMVSGHGKFVRGGG